MIKLLIGFVGVFVLAGLGWVVAFGATAPCEAMTLEARKLAGQTKAGSEKMIADSLAAAKPGEFSALECTALSVRMKAFGSPGVKVMSAAAKK